MPADVFGLAETLLSRAVEVVEATGREPPERRYVSNGPVAFDCELLAVEVENLRTNPPGAPVGNAAVLVADLAVYLVRDVPTTDDRGGAPSAETLLRSAETMLEDAAALLDAVFAFATACRSVSLTGTVFPSEGALGGPVVRLSASLF